MDGSAFDTPSAREGFPRRVFKPCSLRPDSDDRFAGIGGVAAYGVNWPVSHSAPFRRAVSRRAMPSVAAPNTPPIAP